MPIYETENDVLVSLFEVVKAMLNYDEDLIMIGRDNATQDTFSKNYIVLDYLASAPQSKPKRYFDDKKEIEYWETRMAGTFTLEFYGEKCNKNHIDFINLIRCQESIEAQNKYEIVLFDPRNTNNLKQFTNSKTFDRYEVEVVIQYFIRSAIDRKRIDTADINYLIER